MLTSFASKYAHKFIVSAFMQQLVVLMRFQHHAALLDLDHGECCGSLVDKGCISPFLDN